MGWLRSRTASNGTRPQQVPLPASIRTPALALCPPLRPICLARTTTFASDEPGATAPSVILPKYTPPLLPPPTGGVLEYTLQLLPLPPGVCARGKQPSPPPPQVIRDLETIWTFLLSNRALEVPGLLEQSAPQSIEYAGLSSVPQLMLQPSQLQLPPVPGLFLSKLGFILMRMRPLLLPHQPQLPIITRLKITNSLLLGVAMRTADSIWLTGRTHVRQIYYIYTSNYKACVTCHSLRS